MIHYKFKGTSTWDRLSSDSGAFSVLELKREIVKAKRLNKGNADFDLVITDAQSGANYSQDGYLIPRNAAVIVRRVPTTKQKALLLRPVDETLETAKKEADEVTPGNEEPADEFGDPIYSEAKDEEAASNSKELQEEEAKMMNVLNKAAQYKSFGNRSMTFGTTTNEGAGGMDEFRRKVAKVGGRNEFAGGGTADKSNRTPPSHYICNRCNKPGHFIRFCPTNGNSEFDPKRPKNATGIPRSFLQPIAAEEAEREIDPAEEEEKERSGGTVMLEQEKDGQKVSEYYLARPNNYEFQRFYGKGDGQQDRASKKRSQPSGTPSPNAFLTCQLCNNIFRDAVAVSCCFTTFCDECIRQELVISSSSCPMCGFTVAHEELVVNRGLRKLVDDYLVNQQQPIHMDRIAPPPHLSNNKPFRTFAPM